ncbi:hypothetical protein [Mesotoga sp. TolDC]|uniref:hypothetical protein n=1 Tax=Mesotoga sp. TolDC TaxID=1389250 RepID=UPI0011B75749|nr:hypothetical protein [Mesotoga sp. TolDC]
MCDEPNGKVPEDGGVAEAVCPWCGKLVYANIPGIPNSSYMCSANRCPNCKGNFEACRISNGSWYIRRP